MTQVVESWLLANTPSDAAPYVLWMANNYGTARPMLVLLFGAVIVLEASLIWIVWRALR